VSILGAGRSPGFRGSLLPRAGEGWVLCTVHPAYLLRGKGDEKKAQDHLFPYLAGDIYKAVNHPVPIVPRIHIYQNPCDVRDAYRAARLQQGDELLVSVDIEGIDEPNIVGVSFDDKTVWVMEWSAECREFLTELFQTAVPIFHNAPFDVPELQKVGVVPPKTWRDTINLAACYNQVSGMLNLQCQVLSYVPGAVAWKGLVDHWNLDSTTGTVALYREIWTETLKRLSRQVPTTNAEWYRFYNGLDVAWTYGLEAELWKRLVKQGRLHAYTDLMVPLQAPLIVLGLSGMPKDPDRIEYHKKGCVRLERMAGNILKRYGQEMLTEKRISAGKVVDTLEAERGREREEGFRKFSKADEMGKARTQLRQAKEHELEGFNGDSYQQRAWLMYDWFSLPPVRDPKTKGPSTNEKAVNNLISRLERGTIEPSDASLEEVLRCLHAMRAVKKWATWRRNFLR
jgi:hypothetical protein